MARKIFVSYKYSDDRVAPLSGYGVTTARNYVDKLEERFEPGHIFKGEEGDEDLGYLAEETIKSHLKNRMFDSSVTIVLISKNMKDPYKKESHQWIPWEVSYSLKEIERGGRTSATNAMLAVVLPDEHRSYNYLITSTGCSSCKVISWRTGGLFTILDKNMFNRKHSKRGTCSGGCGRTFHTGHDHSYIYPVIWDDFIRNVNQHIDRAISIHEHIDDYDVVKEIE